jgi:hypothetical protein
MTMRQNQKLDRDSLVQVLIRGQFVFAPTR